MMGFDLEKTSATRCWMKATTEAIVTSSHELHLMVMAVVEIISHLSLQLNGPCGAMGLSYKM